MKFRVLLILVVFALFLSTAAYAGERAGTVKLSIDLSDNPQGITRLWVPYPVSGDYQTIADMSVTGTQKSSAVYGSSGDNQLWLYAEWDKDAANNAQALTDEFADYLRSNQDNIEALTIFFS